MLTIENIESFGEYYIPTEKYDNIRITQINTVSKVLYKFLLTLHNETIARIYLHRQKCTNRNLYYMYFQTSTFKTNKSNKKYFLQNSNISSRQNLIDTIREWLVDIEVEETNYQL